MQDLVTSMTLNDYVDFETLPDFVSEFLLKTRRHIDYYIILPIVEDILELIKYIC